MKIHKHELVPQTARTMGKSARNRAIIQAATAAGKLVVTIHNGAPHFASWNAEKGEVEYTPCPRRNPVARIWVDEFHPKVPK